MSDEPKDNWLVITKEDNELLEKINGWPYRQSDIVYAFFQDESKFPTAFGLIMKVQLLAVPYGIVHIENSHGFLMERACKNTSILEAVYSLVKRKALTYKGVTIGWEGKILNEPRYS